MRPCTDYKSPNLQQCYAAHRNMSLLRAVACTAAPAAVPVQLFLPSCSLMSEQHSGTAHYRSPVYFGLYCRWALRPADTRAFGFSGSAFSGLWVLPHSWRSYGVLPKCSCQGDTKKVAFVRLGTRASPDAANAQRRHARCRLPFLPRVPGWFQHSTPQRAVPKSWGRVCVLCVMLPHDEK